MYKRQSHRCPIRPASTRTSSPLAPTSRATSTNPVQVEVARDVAASGLDVLVDAGRIGHRWEPAQLIEAAEVAVVVTRSSLADVTAARSALHSVRESRSPGAHATVLLVGPAEPYSITEVATALDVEPLPPLPLDPWAAQALVGGGSTGWRFARSPLLRAAGDVAALLVTQLQPLAPRPSVGAS